MPGGAADKAGNRYEDLWLVLRIADLLEGSVSRIRLEPLGKAGTGIEFEIDIDGITWGEQTKDTGRTWTIRGLIKHRALAAAKTQFDLGRHYRFVTSSSAKQLATLASRARKSESFDEYAEALFDGRLAHLDAVADAWKVSPEEAWHLLERVDVKHMTADELERIVAATLQRFYADDPSVVVGLLGEFCAERLHESFTAPQVHAYLESKGLHPRLLAHDANAINQLRETRQHHERRVQRVKPQIGLVPRNDAQTVLDLLRDLEGAQVVVVDGQAGSGKSTVVAAVAAQLDSDGWFVAVARMDTGYKTPTSAELGRAVGLSESPARLLVGVADGSRALLVVDQLDAVSMFSGRMPDSFEAVADVLGEITRAPNVKVLLAARTVDLEDDPRLRSISRVGEDVARHRVGELDVEAVKAQIVESGMQLPTSESTLDLLRTPLHLSVFSRLSESDQTQAYATLQDLYGRFTKEARSRAEARTGTLDWDRTVSPLVHSMSDQEVLAVPAAVVDSAPQNQVEALISESVLVRDGPYLAFFHESYFDYLFARAFVADDRDLRDFLLSSGQYLFRRAQTRQVLEYLAAIDRDRFIEVVVDLLDCDEIRFHLKGVVINVLRQYSPTDQDWLALERLAWSGSAIGNKLLTLLGEPDWFDAVDSLGRWEGWLADPRRVDAAFNQTARCARERPARVAELVWPHIAESEDWRHRLCRMISWRLCSGLVDLAVELVELGELDDARGPLAMNSDFWSLIYSLRHEDPAGAARLTGAFLRRGLTCARQDGAQDPFASKHLSTHSQTASAIRDIAAAVPAEFVESVLPFVLEVAMVGQHQLGGTLPTGQRWGYWFPGKHYGVDDIVFTGLDEALRVLAGEDPANCAGVLAELRAAESAELRILACRALAGIGDPDEAVSWLVSDPRNLGLGRRNSPSWASRDLIKECSPSCSSELFESLEGAILQHWPAWEAEDYRGCNQYDLLTALDATRMSPAAERRLADLAERFPRWEPPSPQPPGPRVVESPISYDTAADMSDDDWLHALTVHASKEPTPVGLDLVGGAPQLARVLGSHAKEHPERFARLAHSFSEEIPVVAMIEIIANVEESIDLETLTALCEYAHHTYGAAAGQAVCSAIGRAGAANSSLVALLGAYARDTDPDDETPQSGASSSVHPLLGDLFTTGLNSTRGQAALATASVLFAGSDHVEALLPVVETLCQDRVLAVRVCAAEAVVALSNHTLPQALDLAERLFDAPIDVLDADTSERLFHHALIEDPDRFAPLLAAALNAADEVATRAGSIWAFERSQKRLPPGISTDVCALPTAARRGAAQEYASNVADSLEDLTCLLDDEDPDIRVQMARAIFRLDTVAEPDQEQFIDAVAASTTFPNQVGNLISTFERMHTQLPPNTITVCESAIELADAAHDDVMSHSAVVSQGLVTVLLRLYRQGDAHLRSRCLNIIDRLAEHSVYEIDEALADER